jgi:pyruvate dehydrogenase E2 component (dihydrolipoamide acetyltransferase)
MTEILMPALSDSMEQGLLLQWLIEDGQPVEAGDELVEIETDKATMTYQAEVAGTVQIVVPAGATVAVGEVIARVGAPAGPAPPDLPAAAPASNATPVPSGTASSTNGSAVAGNGSRVTPVARRLAAVHGVALDALQGSGPRGRITKADVLVAAGAEPAQPPPSPAPAPRRSEPRQNGARGGNLVELSRLQQVVARRMAEAKATIPHFQVQTEIVMDDAMALRRRLTETAAAREEATPSVNDLIVKACALALARHPQANGSYRDGRFELHDQVNIGVAVAAEGALVVPTVRDAADASLGRIARETRRLAERVRTGEITPPELSGATFTVSNLGMYGMTAITPVVNPPQAAILGVGAIRATLARDGDAIVDRHLLTLTLSCDHRILYGADAARFLAEIRDLLQSPYALCL